MRNMKITPRRGQFLVLLLILAIPGAAQRPPAPAPLATDPRTLSALLEMSALADALESCAAETTYYVALEALDDSSAATPAHPWNAINNGGGSFAIRPTEGRFRPGRINFLGTFPVWGGPYMTYQDGRTQTGPAPYDQGSPLDPWGSPYYFFTPLGLARGDTGQITLELYGDAFDRYTLVSLGPDGVLSGDDLAWSFGGGVSALALTSLHGTGVQVTPADPGFTAPTLTPLRLRGRNLGTAPANGQVLFNGTAIDGVTSWTDQEIRLSLPAVLAGQSGTLQVKRGAAASNALALTVTASLNAAGGWALYE